MQNKKWTRYMSTKELREMKSSEDQYAIDRELARRNKRRKKREAAIHISPKLSTQTAVAETANVR